MGLYLGNNEISLDGVSEMYLGNDQVYSSGDPNLKIPLCFTANTAGSKIGFAKMGSPTWSGYYSTDGVNWTEYTLQKENSVVYITMTNAGDKVYFKGTGFADVNNYYRFMGSGSIAASGNPMSVYAGDNFKSVTTVPAYGMKYMFNRLSCLTSAPPILPVLTIGEGAYDSMFYECTSLITPPEIYATSVGARAFSIMFYNCNKMTKIPKFHFTSFDSYTCQMMFKQCSKIKLSATQTGDYQTPYRIPYEGTGIETGTDAFTDMFLYTGGSFTGTPTINTTYYTSNEVI